MMTKAEIDYCRRIGRDEIARRSTIGLAELDALCATADDGVDARAEVRRLTEERDAARKADNERRAVGRSLFHVTDDGYPMDCDDMDCRVNNGAEYCEHCASVAALVKP